MNITAILLAVLVLGGLGVLFGQVLTFADKKFAIEKDERVLRVRECLAGANCGACGFAGCDAFAEAVVKGEAPCSGCAPGGSKTANQIAAVMGGEAGVIERRVARVACQGVCGVAGDRYLYDGVKTCAAAVKFAGGPKLCTYGCAGLGDCAAVCPSDAILVKDGVAQVNENRCTGCGLCEKACPRGIIAIEPENALVKVRCKNGDVGKAAVEVCSKACRACRLCVKACEAGAITMVNNCAVIDQEKCTHCGKCIEACKFGCITQIL